MVNGGVLGHRMVVRDYRRLKGDKAIGEEEQTGMRGAVREEKYEKRKMIGSVR